MLQDRQSDGVAFYGARPPWSWLSRQATRNTPKIYPSAGSAAVTLNCVSFLTCDGTGLTRNAILKWQEDWKIQWHDIVPGKPT